VRLPSDVSPVDLAILLIVGLFVVDDLRRGFMAGLLDLFGVALGLLAALILYNPLAQLLVERVELPYAVAKPVAFGLVWLLSDLLLASTLRRSLAGPVDAAARSSVGRYLGLFTGAARGAVVATLVLGVVSALPLPEPVTREIASSRAATALGDGIQRTQSTASNVLGDAVQETIGLLTVRPESTERVSLPFRVDEARFDPSVESRMLDLVNAERAKVRAPPLTVDPTMVEVARDYSRAMFAGGFFAHVDPEGRTPFDRMRAGGVRFSAAGENLALAPTVQLAHDGLMNSPGHRANILNPGFRRVGIGVADGGMHGKIFTQNFAD
jgi:uncharacterized protein YkwD